uniref:Endonuclease/exonuclease/phosphatase domain-containing protein n=1 Tax=Oncorhynchus kisutch TaxID=8019 RepID=A0A8C7M5I3_ONCKI
MAQSTGSLSIITWNTCGVKPTKGLPNKLIDIMNFGKKQKADVIFLQETHIGPKGYNEINEVRGWTSYFTVYSPRSKGVAILVNKNIPHYQYICNDEDYAGDFMSRDVGYLVLYITTYIIVHLLSNK